MNGPKNERVYEMEEQDMEEHGEVTAEDLAFEQELAVAMKRRLAPPTGFAENVARRAQAGERAPARVVAMPGRWRAAQAWAAGAIAAGLVLGVGIQTAHRRQERVQERVEATHQFEVASQIEQQTLERTREKLSRQGISLGE